MSINHNQQYLVSPKPAIVRDELARFGPDHYRGRRIDPALIASGKETISTFGHGLHACPAQKFSHNMCKVLLSLLPHPASPYQA